MERPVYLTEAAYEAILRALADLDDIQILWALRACGYVLTEGMSREGLVAAVLETPSRYLYGCCEVLSNPDLLVDLFIEFADAELDAGVTYLIDREAAEEITAGDPTVLLRIGREGMLVPRTRIVNAFAAGCKIDYRERR